MNHEAELSEILGAMLGEATKIEPLAQDAEQKKRPVKMTGRLVDAPRFTERNDSIRANLVLAQPAPDGETTFHKMYSTGRFARALSQKALSKGDLVEVTGVWQEQEEPAANGQVILKTSFYCYGARKR